MGTYGFLRFCLPLFPTRACRSALVFALAVIGDRSTARWVSTVQPD
jgi:NADH:ubiquinone oxidoreductase subunit 4 (subunit M)